MSKLSQKKRLRAKKHDNAIAALRANSTMPVAPLPAHPGPSTLRIDELRRTLRGHQDDLRLLFVKRREHAVAMGHGTRNARRMRDGRFPETVAHISQQIRNTRAEIARLSS